MFVVLIHSRPAYSKLGQDVALCKRLFILEDDWRAHQLDP